jgi:hypothetical protein
MQEEQRILLIFLPANQLNLGAPDVIENTSNGENAFRFNFIQIKTRQTLKSEASH